MQWQSWAEFWDMGGKAFFVWGSYGFTFALIAIELVHIGWQRKNTLQRLLRWRRATGKDHASGNPTSPESHS